ncbi:hypothetical protein J8273_1758 [Carpediemonas membranifera]|uniref:Uncharacterized protein n=1 Tax=Carpediemonas membranifera TaxID=201153 RepID=A0A8J6B0K8_9EUKA|nr:hypothetical protein J8273_1758 [Carpediemonas membranifera]|eukprot:KAG9396740.1 hypothetical protein J8273_1758 [Carpediemonas membranifera]
MQSMLRCVTGKEVKYRDLLDKNDLIPLIFSTRGDYLRDGIGKLITLMREQAKNQSLLVVWSQTCLKCSPGLGTSRAVPAGTKVCAVQASLTWRLRAKIDQTNFVSTLPAPESRRRIYAPSHSQSAPRCGGPTGQDTQANDGPFTEEFM